MLYPKGSWKINPLAVNYSLIPFTFVHRIGYPCISVWCIWKKKKEK